MQSGFNILLKSLKAGPVRRLLVTLLIPAFFAVALFPGRGFSSGYAIPLKQVLSWQSQSVADFISAASGELSDSAGKATLAVLQPFSALVDSRVQGKTVLEGSVTRLLTMGALRVSELLQNNGLIPSGGERPLARKSVKGSGFEKSLELPGSLTLPEEDLLPESQSPVKSLAHQKKSDSGPKARQRGEPLENEGKAAIVVRVAGEGEEQKPLTLVLPQKPFHREDPSVDAPVLADADREEFFTDYLEKTQEEYLKQESPEITQLSSRTKDLVISKDHLGQVILSQTSLALKASETVNLKFRGFDRGPLPNLASRDAGLVRVHATPTGEPAYLQAAAAQKGKTELYLVYRHQVTQVLSAFVGQRAESPLVHELTGPQDPLARKELASNQSGLVTAERPAPIRPFLPLLSNGEAASLVSNPSSFALAQSSIRYQKVIFKLIDDRSDLKNDTLIPVQNVRISVPGTPFTAVTDGKGESLHTFIPASARFILRTDGNSAYAPSVKLVGPDDYINQSGDTTVIVMKLALRNRLDYQLALAWPMDGDPSPEGFTMREPASLCATIRDPKNRPLEGISVRLSAPGSYITYLDGSTGLPGPFAATGSSGRFCVFNPEEGAIGIKFLNEEGDVIDTLPAGLFSSHHQDMDFVLFDRREVRTRLAAIPPAEQHAADFMEILGRYSPVDMANLIPLGGEHGPMAQHDYGLVGSVDPLPVHQGRICYVSEASEFEMSYQCMNEKDASTGQHVTPLVPVTFLEALSSGLFKETASELQRPDLGAIIVEHGDLDGQDEDEKAGVRIEVVNATGAVLQSGFEKSESLLSKSVVFNVVSGVYNVLVWNSEDILIASDTVSVFEGATSYIRTGNQIVWLNQSISSAEHQVRSQQKKG